MNYITQLKLENSELKEKLGENRRVIVELHTYLLSKKFHCDNKLDGYVHVQDIMTRINCIL